MKDKVEPSEQTDASVTYGPNRISADDLHVVELKVSGS